MKKSITILLGVLSISCLLAGGCHPDAEASVPGQAGLSPDSIRILTIGTADSGGTMYPVGKAIAQAISDSDNHLKINLSASNGSSANVRALESGDFDLGLVSGDVAFAAANGTGEFDGRPFPELRAIAAVYPSLSNWMALSSSRLAYVHDLKGKRLGVGPQDSTTELSASIVLNLMEIDDTNSTLVNCGLGSGAEEVKEQKLDAVHGFTGIPIDSMVELSAEESCILLQYTQEELFSIIRQNPFYYQDVIPAGTYHGQENDVPTFGIKCLLCVSADMDEELVYELTSILYDNTEYLGEAHASLLSMSQRGFMYDDLPITLHPGAERFYREKGLLPTN